VTPTAAGILSPTGRRPFRPASRAFTLLEIVVALALLGLVAGLFISAGSEMLRARERTMADIFWEAVQGARLQAVQEDTTVLMSFDEKNRRVVWRSGGSSHELAWPGKKLEFLPTERNDSVLLGGQLVGTGAMPVVRFYADGCADRFRAQLTDVAGQVTRLEMDSWTCAPVLRPAS